MTLLHRNTAPTLARTARAPLWLTALALSAGALLGCAPDERRPDLVLISLDSVRADSLTFRDPRAAPHLAAFAERGTIFSQAVSGTSWTLPAHAQMLTGTPPPLHGVQADDLIIDPRMPFLPELLQRAGYRTAGVFTTGYLWGDYGFSRGYDSYQSAIHESDFELEDASRAPRGVDWRFRGLEVGAAAHINSPLIVKRVRTLLETIDNDEPLFLFLHVYDPHYDYIPPQPWDRRFDAEYKGTMTGAGFWDNPAIWNEDLDPPRRISSRDLEHVIALYRGEIGWTDQNLGEIFALLEEHGRLRRSVVAVTADHGEEFFEHDARGHRHTLFEEVVRVPLLIVPPEGQEHIPTTALQASLSDLAPTLLDYAGIDIPASMHGRSLRPAVEGETLPERPVVSSLYFAAKSARGKQRHRMLHSVRTPEHKLIRSLQVSQFGKVRIPSVAYFDLLADPDERHPVTDPEDPRLVAAWDLLEDEMDRIRARYGALDRTPPEERTTDMANVLHDRLAALGYVEAQSLADDHPSLLLPWGLGPAPRVVLGASELEPENEPENEP